ncbi:MAG: nucleotidyltransferase family protein [Planctomycetes bacterium]|nr:nucleotidyltransferase family protein [Planctomycetota bacterium]
MERKEDVLKILKALKPELRARFNVKEIGLFGSFVREEQYPGSDIDVLAEFGDDASFFDLVRLALFLEEKFQQRVDVVPKESIRPELRESVLHEAVML